MIATAKFALWVALIPWIGAANFRIALRAGLTLRAAAGIGVRTWWGCVVEDLGIPGPTLARRLILVGLVLLAAAALPRWVNPGAEAAAIAAEVNELEAIEKLVAESPDNLSWKEIAARLGMPTDRARQRLATLRNQMRVSAFVQDGDVTYAPGERCRSRIPVHAPKAPAVVRSAAPAPTITPPDPVRVASPTASQTVKDGTSKRLLHFLAEIDKPLTNAELAGLAGIPEDKCTRTMRYLVNTRRAARAGAGETGTWRRVGKPYPDEPTEHAESPSPGAYLGVDAAAEGADVSVQVTLGTEAERAETIREKVEEVLGTIPRMQFLQVLDSPRVECAITAEGDVLVDDRGTRSRIPQRVAREIFKLIRRLDGGLLDG